MSCNAKCNLDVFVCWWDKIMPDFLSNLFSMHKFTKIWPNGCYFAKMRWEVLKVSWEWCVIWKMFHFLSCFYVSWHNFGFVFQPRVDQKWTLGCARIVYQTIHFVCCFCCTLNLWESCKKQMMKLKLWPWQFFQSMMSGLTQNACSRNTLLHIHSN